MNNQKLKMASVYHNQPMEATLYWENDTDRTVIKYEWIHGKCMSIQTTRLMDFDPIKNRWMTDRGSRNDYLETKKEATAKWKEILAEIEKSTLVKDERNSNWKCSWYYPDQYV